MIASARRTPTFDGLGTSDDTLTAIHRLRYKVYCLEEKFVGMDDCPDALETDEYDAHSTHFAGADPSGNVVATVRLVPYTSLGFPLERHAGRLFPEFRQIPQYRTAEISRLIVDKPLRRDTLRDPRLLLGLLWQVCEESVRAGFECFVAAMERGLWRLLQSHGIFWTPVGEKMDYYGEVIPYWSSLDALRRGYENLMGRLSSGPAFRYVRVPAAVEAI